MNVIFILGFIGSIIGFLAPSNNFGKLNIFFLLIAAAAFFSISFIVFGLLGATLMSGLLVSILQGILTAVSLYFLLQSFRKTQNSNDV